MSSQFGTDLLALVRKHYPAALDGDGPQAGACAADLAIALGGLLAFALRFRGAEAGARAIDLMVERMVESAETIDAEAGPQLRSIITRMIGPPLSPDST